MNTYLLISVYIIVCFSINSVKLQDQLICPQSITPVQPEVKLPIFDDNSKYQAAIERNEVSLRGSEEFIEYYDGMANIGISAEVFGELNLFTYNFFPTDELIVYYPYSKTCSVYKLSGQEAQYISPFPIVDVNGTKHILSPLNSLLNGPNFKFVYIGKNNIRGIPVNQWQTCTYSRFELKTYNITVSFSDPSLWKPAAVDSGATAFQSIPVEIRLLTKKDTEDTISTVFYTITDFKPFIDLELEDYTTPDGVYCQGRKNIRELPDLPHSFSFQAQLVDEQEFEEDRGLISTLFEQYSYKHQLFEYFYNKNNSYTKEIHDFNTGLKYKFNQFSNECKIDKIDIQADSIDTFTTGIDVKLKDPSMFFSFDKDTFQFVGFKRTHGVDTEVWIGPKNILGLTTYYQWHFLADGWNRTDISTSYKIPVYLRIFFDFPLPNSTYVVQRTSTYNIFNFRPFEVYLSEFDLSKCSNDLTQQSFSFELKHDANLTLNIKSNMQSFREAVTLELKEKARVTLLRISHVQILFKNDQTIVLFNMYEKLKFYGNVQPPKYDLKLVDAVAALNQSFLNDQFIISFKVEGENSPLVVPVDKTSFSFRKITNENVDIIITEHVKVEKKGYSSTSVAVGTLIMVFVGIGTGFLVVLLESKKKIQILKPFY